MTPDQRAGGRQVRQGCPNYVRHWFAPYGQPTIVSPRCVRCGAPNPRWTQTIEAEMRLAVGDKLVEEMLRG